MNRQRMRGFSLTELLVAVAVGSLIMMGIYSVFMNSLNVFQGQQEVGQIQFNAKAVTAYMREKIANAGSGIQADIPLPTMVFINNASTISNYYQPGSDAIQVRTFGNAGDIMNIEKYMGSAATATLGESYIDNNPTNGENTSVGNLLLVWGGTATPGNYALVEITHAVHGGTETETSVNFSPGLSMYNTPGGLGDEYDGGFAIMVDRNSMNSLTFFVDSTNVLRMATGGATATFNLADPGNALNPSALPLLDDVEDFQVELGFDVDDDNVVDNWTFSDAGFDINDLLAVKCYVLCRAPRADRFASNITRPDIDQTDDVTYPDAPDNVRRRLYSFSVQLRNRLN